MEYNWWIHLNKEHKEEQYRCFTINFVEILRTPFFKNNYGVCFWRRTRRNQTTAHEIPIEQMLSLNDSLWIIFGNPSKWTRSNIFL